MQEKEICEAEAEPLRRLEPQQREILRIAESGGKTVSVGGKNFKMASTGPRGVDTFDVSDAPIERLTLEETDELDQAPETVQWIIGRLRFKPKPR